MAVGRVRGGKVEGDCCRSVMNQHAEYRSVRSVSTRMAAGARLGGVTRYTGRRPNPALPTATISVGRDDWANQVINNVVGHLEDEEPVKKVDAVQLKIEEKKRLFHTGRLLELKNLPDGVTDQVNTPFIHQPLKGGGV